MVDKEKNDMVVVAINEDDKEMEVPDSPMKR